MNRHMNVDDARKPVLTLLPARELEFTASPEPPPVYAITGRSRTAPDFAKSLSLSLVLHLIGIAAIPLLSSTFLVKRPCPMVIDFTVSYCPPAASSRKVDREPPAAREKKVSLPSPPVAAAKQPPRPVPQPARVTEKLPATGPAVSETTAASDKPAAGAEKGAVASGVTEGNVAGNTPRLSAAAGRGEAPSAETAKQRYLKEHFIYIRDLVARKLVYPVMARKMGWEGKAVVAFMVMEDGQVGNVRLMESSGVPLLDRSALETIRRTAPFPRPPVRAEIVLPVTFRLM